MHEHESHAAERLRDENATPWYGVHDPREFHPVHDAAQLRKAAKSLVQRIEDTLATSFRGWDTREQGHNDALLVWVEGEVHRLRHAQEELSLEEARIADEDPAVAKAAGLGDANLDIHGRCNHLSERLLETPSATLIGAAVKLRMVLDPEYGIESIRSMERNALLDVLLQVEREASRLTHAEALRDRMEQSRQRQRSVDEHIGRVAKTPEQQTPEDRS